MTRIARLCLGMMLACLLTGCGSAFSHQLQLVARHEIGPAYADSSINVPVFRNEPIVRLPDGRHVVGYYDPEGYVRLAVLGTDSAVERAVRVEPRIEQRLLGDGHCAVNLGVATDGTLHMIYGAHATRPYYGTVALTDLTGSPPPASITAAAWPYEITYPQFYTIGGELQCWFRADPTSVISRVRYDAAAHRLRTDREPFLLPGDAVSVYMNQLAVVGPRLALSWVYRLPLQDNKVINQGLYLATSDDGGATWQGLKGAPVAAPIDRSAAPVGLSLPLGAGLLNQTSAAFGPDGRYYMTYYAKDPQGLYQELLATVDLTTKEVYTEAVSTNTTAYELLGRGTLYLPLSRPQVAVSEYNIHVAYRHNNDLVLASRPRDDRSAPWTYIREPIDNLGAWEPTYCSGTWQAERRLLVYVQAARQGELDTGIPGPPGTATVYEFR